MKLRINKNTRVILDPDWRNLIGKTSNDVDAAIQGVWPFPLRTIAMGYQGYRCVSYQTETNKAVLFFDESDCLLDVFVYRLGIEAPSY